MEAEQLAKVGLVGAGAFAAYEFLYRPWADREAIRRATEAAALANAKKGMGIEEAAENAIAGACVAAAAAKLHIPPEQAKGYCQGIGILATKGIELTAKGAAIAGKAIGKGAVVVGREVKAGTVAVAKGSEEIVKQAVSVPLAPVRAAVDLVRHPVSGVRKAVTTAVYRNPVAAAKAVGSAIAHPASTIKSVITAPLHPVATVKKAATVAKKILCFGFCGVGDVDYLAGAELAGRARARTVARALARGADRNPFAVHARTGNRSPARKARGLAPLPAAGRARGAAAGVEFYTRHL